MEDWNENLLKAAKEGNIEAIELCLQKNADINFKDEHGLTAFMVASKKGNTKAAQLLFKIECEKFYDNRCPGKLELMIDKAEINNYITLLKSGTEKKRDIRLVVVGEKGTGKTSLIYKLFGEEIKGVTSTNGIEIHTMRCKAKSDDGSWTNLEGQDKETECHSRLLRPYERQRLKTLYDEVFIPGIKDLGMLGYDIPVTSIDESAESVTVSKPPEIVQPQGIPEPEVNPHGIPASNIKLLETTQQHNKQFEQTQKDFNAMRADKSNVDLEDKEEYATLFLWDFAGDEAFYHTHQTFLSPDAIYLVVAKLNEADDKQAQGPARYSRARLRRHNVTRVYNIENF